MAISNPPPSNGSIFPARSIATSLLNVIGIIAVATLTISFNGGIGIGVSNHAGLLPVVRRILDPNYLPGDFNIALRLYHHRVFAWLIAALSTLIGEERGIILLHLTGAILFSFALWFLCRALQLSRLNYLAAGLFLATGFLWTGLGLEENTFVGNVEVQPPLFAHAFVLLAAACLLQSRYRLAAFFAGMTVLFHLQIGVICTLMIAPFYLVKLKSFGPRELIRLAASYLIPAAFAVIHLLEMMQRGLLRPASSAYSLAEYIDFRHPHHFELMSAAHASWVGGHVLLQTVVWFRLRQMKRNEARLAGGLLVMSLMLVVLALLHFTDYYLIKNDKLANIQFIRLSPLITVFGALCLILFVKVVMQQFRIEDEITRRTTGEEGRHGERHQHQAKAARGRIVRLPVVSPCLPLPPWLSFAGRIIQSSIPGERRLKASLPGLASAGLLLLASIWGIHLARQPEAPFHFGVVRYSERRTAWVAMCNWIRDNGPRATVYLTPPAFDGFTALTSRSNVVEFKINPDGALLLAEWFERLKDLTGGKLAHERGFKNRKPLNKAYSELSAEQMIALGARYHAGYAVVPKTSGVKFETLHENNELKLVKLP